MAQASAVQVSRTRSDGKVQSLDVRGVRMFGVFGGSPEFLPSPLGSRARFPLHLNDSVVSPLLDHLSIRGRGPENTLHDLPIKFGPIRGDHRDVVGFTRANKS